ncbi:MAG: Alpha/beta hydrolase fold protein [Caulobacter sp.]|nr:Alpha/beta hydrolase fold protein [Caulobacter sp.]
MTVRRVLVRALLALLVLLVLLTGAVAWRMLAPISTPAFRGDDGKVLAGSIAVVERWPVGGVEQSVIIRGRDRANPVLLFVHGGPGSSETGPLRRFNAALEDRFVVVYWDQRYAGQSFDSKLPIPEHLTIARYVDDLGIVVDRLRTRFGRERVGLLAHSWGTVTGILYAEDHPDKLYAYVGVGQVANVPESEKRSYAWVLREARARHVDKAVAELERLGPPPRAGSIFTPRDWIMTFGGSFHGDMDNTTLIRESLAQREINGRDLAGFLSAGKYSDGMLHGEFSRFVVDDRPRDYAVPIFLVSGRYDQQSEASVARRFYDRVTAPKKAFVWFEQSAHSPMFEEPKAFNDWVAGAVAPLGERARARATPPAS